MLLTKRPPTGWAVSSLRFHLSEFAAFHVIVVVASQHTAHSIPATSSKSSRLLFVVSCARVVVIFSNWGSAKSDRLLLRGSRGGKLGQDDIRKNPRGGKKGGAQPDVACS